MAAAPLWKYGARREPRQDRSLDAVEVGAFAADQGLAWIGGVEGLRLAAGEGVRTSLDEVHGQIGRAERTW